jgi:dTDP-4-dehydrorhamnose reductase
MTIGAGAVAVVGGRGQLGRALVSRGVASPDVDITDAVAVARALDGITVLINAAAYTAVDKAESERDRAFAVNRDGAGILARACADKGVRLLHVSTDYVFDGTGTRPYREDDPLAPLGVYGESKAAGEALVHATGGIVVRTSWLFGHGGPSFLHTMVRLATERPLLRVVDDQRGCPTFAGDLADALLKLAAKDNLAPTYHYCGDGETTWYGFASAIVDEARKHRALKCERLEPITTADYPTPAKRPAYSVLDTARIRAIGIVPPSWTTGMRQVIAEISS